MMDRLRDQGILVRKTKLPDLTNLAF